MESTKEQVVDASVTVTEILRSPSDDGTKQHVVPGVQEGDAPGPEGTVLDVCGRKAGYGSVRVLGGVDLVVRRAASWLR